MTITINKATGIITQTWVEEYLNDNAQPVEEQKTQSFHYSVIVPVWGNVLELYKAMKYAKETFIIS